MGVGWLVFGIIVATIFLAKYVSTIWLYVGGIALGVVLAFYGFSNRSWGTAVIGVIIAIAATATSGLI